VEVNTDPVFSIHIIGIADGFVTLFQTIDLCSIAFDDTSIEFVDIEIAEDVSLYIESTNGLCRFELLKRHLFGYTIE